MAFFQMIVVSRATDKSDMDKGLRNPIELAQQVSQCK